MREGFFYAFEFNFCAEKRKRYGIINVSGVNLRGFKKKEWGYENVTLAIIPASGEWWW